MHDSDDLPAILGGRPVFPDGPPAWPPAWPEVKAALDAAFADGSWGQYHGPHVRRLEGRLCGYFGVPHALTCASGTLAVEAALRAVGVGGGDEVVLAAYDYDATFLGVHAVGALPVLIDVHPANWNLDPAALAAAVGPRTKAVVCSHLHGGLVPMREVTAVAARHNLAVIEDAAQCPGAVVQGRKAGTWGDAGVLSFGGSKLLSAGRGGGLLFRDARPYQRAKVWLARGVQQWAALSELQAAALLPQLDALDARTVARREAVGRIVSGLDQDGPLVAFPDPQPDSLPGYYKAGFQYQPESLGLSREAFVRVVRAEGVAFDAGFKAFHVGRSPARYRAGGPLTHAADAHNRCVILHHPVLSGSPGDVANVVRAVRKVYRNADKIRAASA
jgi:dTDP-4-amino-4,6-dideoxygalactose transaminase